MIIFTSPFILSEAEAGRPLTYPRIGYQTWLRGLAASAVTASTETAEGPKDMPLRHDTPTYWLPSALPATWEVDLGATQDVDYVGIAGHTIGSCGASVLVETSIDVGVYVALAAEVSPGYDTPLLFLDDSRAARRVRITVSGTGSIPKIAVVYAGQILAMQRSIYGGHMPITLARTTAMKAALSRGGQFIAQDYRRLGVTGNASFRYLEPAWYRENFDLFVQQARKGFPYFFAWRPETYPLEVAYVWTDSDIAPANMGIKDFMSVAWPMIGIGNE